jgi:trehalose 6-phosphate phosphatase
MAEHDRAPPLALLEGAALFLDFDGTLVELAETPDAIEVPEALQPLLERLAIGLGGRLAIVSGRSVEDLERYLAVSGLSMSGSHGGELRLAGSGLSAADPPAGLAEARAAVLDFARGASDLLVEEKPAGVALHYRQAPERAQSVSDFMAGVAKRTGLSLLHGKMVAELRPPGADKGAAIRMMMAKPPFAGAPPVFVGDDVTDEDGFRAAAEMGGGGVLVGPPRATQARWRLDDVPAVAHWLRAAAGEMYV